MRGFVAWVPMLTYDDEAAASLQSETFQEHRVTYSWDGKRELGNIYAKTLNLSVTAWDVYILYAPGIRWEWDEPPQPTFWMHQLPPQNGADQNFRLNPEALHKELKTLLEKQTSSASER